MTPNQTLECYIYFLSVAFYSCRIKQSRIITVHLKEGNNNKGRNNFSVFRFHFHSIFFLSSSSRTPQSLSCHHHCCQCCQLFFRHSSTEHSLIRLAANMHISFAEIVLLLLLSKIENESSSFSNKKKTLSG